MNMIRTLSLFVVFGLVVGHMSAQDVVISEYFNDVSQATEWTEILVVKDNMDLRGYIVTDNRGEADQRQSGPQFLNISKWAHVRSGTIIVIRHGTLAEVRNTDSLEADGYLELSQFDTRYFRIVNVDGAAGSSGMNINQDRDFVQILKPDTTHCHGLAHTRSPATTWDATGPPKVAYDTSSLGSNRAVWVSGSSLAAYGMGLGSDSVGIGLNFSPGFPNALDNNKLRAGLIAKNHWYWRQLREPEWTTSAPTITVQQQVSDRHVISWTPLIDEWTADGTTGYLILRDTLNFTQFPADGISDGDLYTVGQKIGTATIIAVQTTAQGTTYTDASGVNCGVNYTYRVYGYRFAADDKLTLAATLDTTARGRQYNERIFAQSAELLKPNPSTPKVYAARNAICPGDTVSIWTDPVANVTYQWFLNGSILVGATTARVVVNQPGSYNVRIVAPGGCFAESDFVIINGLPAAEVKTSPAGLQKICVGDTLVITAETSSSAYEWLLNGTPIPGQTGRTLRATAPGDYIVRVASPQGCPGVSQVVTVQYYDVRYRVEPTTLDLGQLGACETSASGTVTLFNDGKEPITISSISMPPNFALSSPAPGFTLAPGASQVVRILYSPSGTGVSTGTVRFTALPCSVSVNLQVRGERTVALASLDRAGVDFGVYTACPNSDIRPDSAFRITNEGTSVITVRAPLLSPPFYLLTAFLQRDLQPGESFDIRVQYRPLGADLNRGVSQEMAFPFTSTDCRDTLRATLQGASYLPTLQAAELLVNVGSVLSCVGFADTVITIANTSPVAAQLDGNASPFVKIDGTPITVSGGASVSVRVTVTPPPTPGPFSILDTLIGSPCDIRIPIRYSGRFVEPTFSAAPSVADAGTVDLCSGEDSSTTVVTLYATSGIGLRSPITSVSVNAPFSSDLRPGVSIVDSLKVNVTYRPTQPGLNVDTLRVTFGPCDDTITVILRGEATLGAFAHETSGLPLPVITNGQTADHEHRIINTGGSPITVEPVTGVAAPFSILSEVPPLPAVLAPGDTATIRIRYSYAGPDRTDVISVSIGVPGPCGDTVVTSVTGRTAPDTVEILTGLTLSVPENVTTVLGTQASIPVFLTSTTPLLGKGLAQFTSTIRYDASVFKPESTTAPTQGIQATIIEDRPGVATLNVTSATEIVENAATPLLRISGPTFLGSSRTTPIFVDTVISARAMIDGDDGSLILSVECAVETQVIARGLPPSMIVKEVHDGTVVVEITTLTDDAVMLSIHTIRGEISAMNELRVSPGRHVVTMRLPDPSGVMFVSMQHGRYRHTSAVMSIR